MGCGERPAAGCGLRGGRLRGAGCGAADVSSLDFFAACSHAASDPNKVAKNSQRSSSTRRPLRLINSQRSEGEPDADPPVWFCERSLEGESEQNLERAKAHGGAAASVRRRRIGLPRATTPIGPSRLRWRWSFPAPLARVSLRPFGRGTFRSRISSSRWFSGECHDGKACLGFVSPTVCHFASRRDGRRGCRGKHACRHVGRACPEPIR
jgi:hypothetical protein